MTLNDQKKAAFPHYGDVYEVDLNPIVGSERGKR
jgi:mRNA-degrading endonuclease toxin of MazEF toxin-antitoxin module